MQSAKEGAAKTFVGCLLFVSSQIIIWGYWMKYSTLGVAAPLYTSKEHGGKWRQSFVQHTGDPTSAADDKNDGLEIIERGEGTPV